MTFLVQGSSLHLKIAVLVSLGAADALVGMLSRSSHLHNCEGTSAAPRVRPLPYTIFYFLSQHTGLTGVALKRFLNLP